MKNHLLTTGEFAKLCNVNKQTLIYYEDIGLFTPTMKDKKGFRYYHIQLFDLFTVIQLLKEFGMPLEEIKSYLAQRSPEQFNLLMKRQQEHLQQKIVQLQQMEQIVQQKITHYEKALQIDVTAISFQHIESRHLYVSQNYQTDISKSFSITFTEFIKKLQEKHLNSGHQIGSITLKKHLLQHQYRQFSYFYMEQPARPIGSPDFLTIQAGLYAVAYHIGEDALIHETYEKIFNEIHRLNYQIGDYAFEEYVFDTTVKNNKQDFVMKIMIQLVNP